MGRIDQKLKIFIACHKKCEVPGDPIYLPLHVGAEGKDDIGFTKDNTGDNISAENPRFCELTGLYWVWKNLDCKYLGLVHYRRYFTMKSRSYRKSHDALDCVLTSHEVSRLLSRYRVLLPKKRHYYIETLYKHYAHTFDERQLDIAREIITERCPEYTDSFDEVMKQTSGYMFNMFIMEKKLSDAYCAWLFPILFELVKRYDDSELSDFDRRYVGRVSERLFNVWLKQQLKYGVIKPEEMHEVDYLYMGEIDWKRKILSFLAAKFFHKKYEKSF